jgi:hypothetical protein
MFSYTWCQHDEGAHSLHLSGTQMVETEFNKITKEHNEVVRNWISVKEWERTVS